MLQKESIGIFFLNYYYGGLYCNSTNLLYGFLSSLDAIIDAIIINEKHQSI
jgi:hypothetical protein